MRKRVVAAAIVVFTVASILVAQRSRSVTTSHQRRDLQTSAVVLSGRVLNEFGEPLSELIQVDLICNGRIRQQAVTTQDGAFTFELNSQRAEDWMDPSIGGSVDGSMEGPVKVRSDSGSGTLDEVPSMGRGRISLVGCELRASPKPGMVSSIVTLGTREALQNPDVGLIIVRKLDSAGATTVSVSLLSAPDRARKAFEKANEELVGENPRFDRAEKELLKAVKEYPEFSAAWNLLARVHLSQGKREEGKECFRTAVKEEPGFIPPYLGLAQAAVQESTWAEAKDWAGKALELDPGHPQALYLNGMGHYYLSEFEQAEQSLSQLYRQDGSSEFPFGLLLIGVVHATQGRIQEAASELQMYLELMPPEQVPANQRAELERQLEQWRADGLVLESSEEDDLEPES